MKNREDKIKQYFNMWLTKNGENLRELFADNIVYTECYGPEYHGILNIIDWFQAWNKYGTVLRWDIKQMLHQGNLVAVEWYFECEYEGNIDGFDGVSIIQFNKNEKIEVIKEFQSKAEHTIIR